jgi:two-component system NtrC family sensor kinase
MVKRIRNLISFISQRIKEFPDYGESPIRYKVLRRNMIFLMIFVTIIPLFSMAIINYMQYRKALNNEIVQPLRMLVNKTKHSFELFLAERVSAVSFIASAYSYRELADEKTLNRIFMVMKKEFGGFVDLGLIDSSGIQVNYAGPYQLKGKNYSEQAWFHETKVRGIYISDVFMGYRRIPHFVIAVEHLSDKGEAWILRSTIDTEKFNNLIASMGLDPSTDAFVLNREGILQTPSKLYGKVLDKCSLPLPAISYEPIVFETVGPNGEDIFMAYTYFHFPPFVLVVVKPKGELLKTWYTLKGEIFIFFIIGILAIFLVVFKLTDILVKRVQESDQKREAAYHEMQYTSKLALIGRLAAGVAHEINNPMAIINEKAGLIKDLLESSENFPEKKKFIALTDSIIQSVDRTKTITHRLLGFARRMDVNIEPLDINELLKEVLGFLEKEAFHRNIKIELQLSDGLSMISSDRGQLQQVFLNILNNAFEAVEDGGVVSIRTWNSDPENIGISIQDNGCGMSEETMRHIFEPFFTTKKRYGTGLGLSITYGIVKRLGGKIEVQSQEGKGTTFTVFLPKEAGKFQGEI